MAERTLEQRIMDAADDYQEAMTQTWRKRARAALEALAARAAAAERLADAAAALAWTDSADYMAGAAEFKAALEAWREASHA